MMNVACASAQLRSYAPILSGKVLPAQCVAVQRRAIQCFGSEFVLRLCRNYPDQMQMPILIYEQAQRFLNATKLWLPGFPAGFRVFRYGHARP